MAGWDWLGVGGQLQMSCRRYILLVISTVEGQRVPNWGLVFYETSSGRSPVQDYIRGLPRAERVRVANGLVDLERYGIDLGMPDVRRMAGTRLWELRIRGPNQHRVFYVTITGRRILLLHAFQKQSRATPRREIEVAEQRLADYRERHSL